MTPAPTETPILTGHLDGFCITFAGREVAVFPAFLGAAAALRTARTALTMLDATLAKAPSRRTA